MTNRALEQIFIGSFVAVVAAITSAIATAIINLVLAGKINYWLAGSVGIAFGVLLGAILLYRVYRAYGKNPSNPFKKMRVTNARDRKGLMSEDPEGKPVGEAWQIKTRSQNYGVYYSIFGPYIQHLPKGEYRAIFRVKVDNVVGENQPIVQIDVASNSKVLGDKRLAGRTLTTRDFKKADEYQDFPLDFTIFVDEGERDVEFRIHSWNEGYLVTLDYVELTRG